MTTLAAPRAPRELTRRVIRHGPSDRRPASVRRSTADDLEQAIRDYGPRLLATARRYLPEGDDAEDAVQDAYLMAYRNLHRFEQGAQLATWLHRIVVNAALMILRKRRRRREVLLGDELGPAVERGRRPRELAPDAGLERDEIHEKAAHLRRQIGELPTTYRRILELRDLQGCDGDRAARLLGISRGAVKSKLHRARRRLRAAMEEGA